MTDVLDQPWFRRVLQTSRTTLLRQYAFNRDARRQSVMAQEYVTDDMLDEYEAQLVREYLLAHPEFLD